MVKAASTLAFVMLMAIAPQAFAQVSRDAGSRAAQPVTSPAQVVNDPLKLEWFSRTVDSILTDRPDAEAPSGTARSR